jgi:hypothetical protein
MSTGDHPLTACHVSRELGIAPQPCAILDVREAAGGDLEQRLKWQVDCNISLQGFGLFYNLIDFACSGQLLIRKIPLFRCRRSVMEVCRKWRKNLMFV